MSKSLVGALCHETKPSKLSFHVSFHTHSLETTSLEAVLTLCCAVAFIDHGATLGKLLLSCKTGALSRAFFYRRCQLLVLLGWEGEAINSLGIIPAFLVLVFVHTGG